MTTNSERLQALWDKEVDEIGVVAASLTSVIWKFSKTRMMLAMFLMIASVILAFMIPVSNTLSFAFPYKNREESDFVNS